MNNQNRLHEIARLNRLSQTLEEQARYARALAESFRANGNMDNVEAPILQSTPDFSKDIKVKLVAAEELQLSSALKEAADATRLGHSNIITVSHSTRIGSSLPKITKTDPQVVMLKQREHALRLQLEATKLEQGQFNASIQQQYVAPSTALSHVPKVIVIEHSDLTCGEKPHMPMTVSALADDIEFAENKKTIECIDSHTPNIATDYGTRRPVSIDVAPHVIYTGDTTMYVTETIHADTAPGQTSIAYDLSASDVKDMKNTMEHVKDEKLVQDMTVGHKDEHIPVGFNSSDINTSIESSTATIDTLVQVTGTPDPPQRILKQASQANHVEKNQESPHQVTAVEHVELSPMLQRMLHNDNVKHILTNEAKQSVPTGDTTVKEQVVHKETVSEDEQIKLKVSTKKSGFSKYVSTPAEQFVKINVEPQTTSIVDNNSDDDLHKTLEKTVVSVKQMVNPSAYSKYVNVEKPVVEPANTPVEEKKETVFELAKPVVIPAFSKYVTQETVKQDKIRAEKATAMKSVDKKTDVTESKPEEKPVVEPAKTPAKTPVEDKKKTIPKLAKTLVKPAFSKYVTQETVKRDKIRAEESTTLKSVDKKTDVTKDKPAEKPESTLQSKETVKPKQTVIVSDISQSPLLTRMSTQGARPPVVYSLKKNTNFIQTMNKQSSISKKQQKEISIKELQERQRQIKEKHALADELVKKKEEETQKAKEAQEQVDKSIAEIDDKFAKAPKKSQIVSLPVIIESQEPQEVQSTIDTQKRKIIASKGSGSSFGIKHETPTIDTNARKLVIPATDSVEAPAKNVRVVKSLSDLITKNKTFSSPTSSTASPLAFKSVVSLKQDRNTKDIKSATDGIDTNSKKSSGSSARYINPPKITDVSPLLRKAITTQASQASHLFNNLGNNSKQSEKNSLGNYRSQSMAKTPPSPLSKQVSVPQVESIVLPEGHAISKLLTSQLHNTYVLIDTTTGQVPKEQAVELLPHNEKLIVTGSSEKFDSAADLVHDSHVPLIGAPPLPIHKKYIQEERTDSIDEDIDIPVDVDRPKESHVASEYSITENSTKTLVEIKQEVTIAKTAIELNDEEMELDDDDLNREIFKSGDPRHGYVVFKGVKLSDEDPVAEDQRTRDVIVARHINHARDKAVGLPLSNINVNYVFEQLDERDFAFKAFYKDIDPNYLPPRVDLRDKGWGTIYEQGSLGSCVANSIAYTVRWAYADKEKEGPFDSSRLFIYYNAREMLGFDITEDTGITVRSGYKAVNQFKTCSERNWPYAIRKYSARPTEYAYNAAAQHHTFTYLHLNVDQVEIKKCLKDGFPISFGLALYESFMSADAARTGNIPYPDIKNERRIGGHCMTIVGYDEEKQIFIVCNSWGTGWGDGGFCFIPYKVILNTKWTSDMWSARVFD